MRKFKVLTHECKTEYALGSKAWNQAIDFSYVGVGQTITAEELAEIHSLNASYYEDVSELVKTGMIEVIE